MPHAPTCVHAEEALEEAAALETAPARLRLSRVRRGLESGTQATQTWAGSTPSNLLGRQSTMEVHGQTPVLHIRGKAWPGREKPWGVLWGELLPLTS